MKVNKVYKIILCVLYSLLICEYIVEVIQGRDFYSNILFPLIMFVAGTIAQICIYHFVKDKTECYGFGLLAVVSKFIVVSLFFLCLSFYIFNSGFYKGSSIADFHSHIWDVILAWVFVALCSCTIIVELTGGVHMLVKSVIYRKTTPAVT